MAIKSKPYALAGMLDLITASASTDETRYYMTRPYLDHGSLDDPEAADTWTIAATDGHVLAVVQLDDTLLRQLYSGDPKPGYVSILTGKKAVNGTATILPVPLEAQFPQWRKVVPASERRITVPAPDELASEPSMALPLWTALTRVALNYEYLTGKRAYMDGGAWSVEGTTPWSKAVTVRYGGPDKAGKHSTTPGLVVIMPMASIADDIDAASEVARLKDLLGKRGYK